MLFVCCLYAICMLFICYLYDVYIYKYLDYIKYRLHDVIEFKDGYFENYLCTEQGWIRLLKNGTKWEYGQQPKYSEIKANKESGIGWKDDHIDAMQSQMINDKIKEKETDFKYECLNTGKDFKTEYNQVKQRQLRRECCHSLGISKMWDTQREPSNPNIDTTHFIMALGNVSAVVFCHQTHSIFKYPSLIMKCAINEYKRKDIIQRINQWHVTYPKGNVSKNPKLLRTGDTNMTILQRKMYVIQKVAEHAETRELQTVSDFVSQNRYNPEYQDCFIEPNHNNNNNNNDNNNNNNANHGVDSIFDFDSDDANDPNIQSIIESNDETQSAFQSQSQPIFLSENNRRANPNQDIINVTRKTQNVIDPRMTPKQQITVSVERGEQYIFTYTFTNGLKFINKRNVAKVQYIEPLLFGMQLGFNYYWRKSAHLILKQKWTFAEFPKLDLMSRWAKKAVWLAVLFCKPLLIPYVLKMATVGNIYQKYKVMNNPLHYGIGVNSQESCELMQKLCKIRLRATGGMCMLFVCCLYAICMLFVCYLYAICMLFVCCLYAICIQMAHQILIGNLRIILIYLDKVQYMKI